MQKKLNILAEFMVANMKNKKQKRGYECLFIVPKIFVKYYFVGCTDSFVTFFCTCLSYILCIMRLSYVVRQVNNCFFSIVFN